MGWRTACWLAVSGLMALLIRPHRFRAKGGQTSIWVTALWHFSHSLSWQRTRAPVSGSRAGRWTAAWLFVVQSVLLFTAPACSSPQDERHPIARLYEQQAEVACPCHASQLGFSSSQRCLDGYIDSYVGLSDESLICLRQVEQAHPVAVGDAVGCWMLAEESYLACLSDLQCTRPVGFIRCEDALFATLRECPTIPWAVQNEWDQCVWNAGR